MGKLCSKGAQTETSLLVPQEEEISIPSYKSDADKLLEAQEKKYNYLSKILFQDYLYSLVNYSSDNATLDDEYTNANVNYSSNDAFFKEHFSSDQYQSFVENKILKHKALYDEAESKEKNTSIFKTFLQQFYIGLAKKLAHNHNQKGGEQADQNSLITKGSLIPVALLFCSGPKYVKIRTLFNLFQDGGQLKPSENLNNFLLYLFLSAGYVMIHVRNELSAFDEFEGVERDEMKKLADSCELKDSQHLVEITNKLIFGEDLSQSLDYESFKAKFADQNKDTSLGFLLSAPGIRFMQLKHNV